MQRMARNYIHRERDQSISDQLYSQPARERHRMIIIAAVLVGLPDGDNSLLFRSFSM